MNAEEQRKARERIAVQAQAKRVREMAAAECKALLANEDRSFYQFDPADQFTRFLT